MRRMTLKSLDLYEIEIDGHWIGKFEVVSTWRGFEELKRISDGALMIGHSDTPGLESMLQNLIGTSEGRQLKIIMISPCILDELKEMQSDKKLK